MKKLFIAAMAALMVVGAGGVAQANHANNGPGPNGHNTFGLCTAYFAGSEKGQEQKRKAPPFQALERAAEDAEQSVEEYCAANGQRPGGRP
ncbi:MAG: hypothetical protein WD232_08750 [Acidimicrobiales bacterium]